MAEDRDVPFKPDPCAFADFSPNLLWRNGMFGDPRAARICFRQKTDVAPNSRSFGVGDEPAKHLRHVLDIALCHRAVVGKFNWQSGFSSQIDSEPGERFAHRMEVRFALHLRNRVAVPAGLRRVAVHRYLSRAADANE